MAAITEDSNNIPTTEEQVKSEDNSNVEESEQATTENEELFCETPANSLTSSIPEPVTPSHDDSNTPISNSQAPKVNAKATTLSKGATVMFKGKEPDDEWFTCTLINRAGTARGKYSRAWNILRDGSTENIDFERDVGDYKIVCDESNDPPLESTAEATDMDMDTHLQALLAAAEERAKNC